ncbi:MAG TPA: DNA-binding domain-containing protein [Steroidobacteraceae bacterium]|nr:DNA-binding domain-containing protein [Steroidobacteraceae bacterium]
MKLAHLQQDFQDYLLHGTGAVRAHVLGSARVDEDTRLGIYAHAYRSRLEEALSSNYPALAKLLDADFAALADAYVRTHDSPFFSIRYYGDDLAGFLGTREEYAGAPLLAELARWEWAMGAVFDAADATPLTQESLACLPPERWAQLRFAWHPSVARLALHWNAPQIWRALTEETPRPAAAFAAQPCQWLLWRQELGSYFRSLPEAEAAALDAARSGWPFAELCELLCEQLGAERAALEAATYLRTWVAAGLIVGLA